MKCTFNHRDYPIKCSNDAKTIHYPGYGNYNLCRQAFLVNQKMFPDVKWPNLLDDQE
jgi:hypothetical protein